MPILVNGEKINDETIRRQVQQLAESPAWRLIPEDTGKAMRLLDAAESMVVDLILVRQEAGKSATPMDPVKDDLRLERTLRNLASPIAEASPEDVRRFFDENAHNFEDPEAIRAAHIVVHLGVSRSEEEARAIIELAYDAVEKGTPFVEVVQLYSDCKEDGGDLGVFRRGSMVPEFEAELEQLQPGQHTPIFKTCFGFHIAELRAPGPASVPFEDAAPQIKRFLDSMLEQQAFQTAIARLRERATICYLSPEKHLMTKMCSAG